MNAFIHNLNDSKNTTAYTINQLFNKKPSDFLKYNSRITSQTFK